MRTLFPLQSFNKAKSFPQSSPLIYIKKPTQAIDRIQISIDSRCLEACLTCFKAEFESRGQKIAKGRTIRAFLFDGCLIELVTHPNKGSHSQLWFFVAIHDPTTLAQEKVAEIIIMVLDSLGLPHDHSSSVSQVEFALDFVPGSPAMLRELTDYLQSSLTMRHGRASSVKMVGTTLYIGKEGNVRQGTKGIRCYPKEWNRVRVEVQANKQFLKSRGVTITSLPLAADFIKVVDYARLYRRMPSREVAQIVAKQIPSLASRRTPLAAMVRAKVEGMLSGLVVLQMDGIRQFLEKRGKRFDKGRLFEEWKLPVDSVLDDWE